MNDIVKIFPQNDELEGALKRYKRYISYINSKKLIIICPEPDSQLEKNGKGLIGELDNSGDGKIFVFFSLFKEGSEEFRNYYKDYLFIIAHYVSKVIIVPFELKILKEIINKGEEKEFLPLKEIIDFYNGKFTEKQ